MSDELERRIDGALALIRTEVLRAARKHGPMKSAHEGYAVILEEVDELWAEVKADRGALVSGLVEATHIGAMAARYIVDVCQQALDEDRYGLRRATVEREKRA